MINFEKELNQDQQKVVFEGDGPCLVLSGPGSGKTRTLVYRTAYLLQKKISPERILLLTFTKKAATEMIERIHSLSQANSKKIYGGTFHHISNLFLREHANEIGYSKGYTIIDEEDSKSIIRAIIKKEITSQFPKPQVVQKIISLSVNSQQNIDDVIHIYFEQIEDKYIDDIKKIAKKYKEKKKESNVMDYDDLLLNFLKILTNERVNKILSQKFLYILVDEYQDTNTIQEKIIKKLSSHNKNILAVGDDSQSIYSFRAANIKNILNFSKNYKNAKIFKIKNNYRSTTEIVEAANYLIKNNDERLEKNLKSVIGNGSQPSILPFHNPKKQASFIIDYIRNNNHLEVAVLFRAHFHAVELELELARNNIPYQLRGGIKFFEQMHIKDVVAFLRVILNAADESSWRRLLLRQDKIGEVTSEKIISKILKYNTINEVLLNKDDFKNEFPESVYSKIELIFNMLETSLNCSPFDKIDIFYNNFYKEYLKLSFDNFQKRKNDILKLKELTLNYKTEEEMLSNFSLSEDFNINNSNKKKIILSTVHQAKGLEWDTVFIINLNEGSFPHLKSLEEGMIEEERRLFYVAITRCKSNLFITYIKSNFGRNQFLSPSRFINEITEEIVYEPLIEDDGEWEKF